MADAPIVHIGENSAEHVAFKLLVQIATNEGKRISGVNGETAKPDRKWLLDTYAECLTATTNRRGY